MRIDLWDIFDFLVRFDYEKYYKVVCRDDIYNSHILKRLIF